MRNMAPAIAPNPRGGFLAGVTVSALTETRFRDGDRTRKCDAHHHRRLLNNKEENAENSSKTTGQKIDKGVNTLPPGMKSPTVETMG